MTEKECGEVYWRVEVWHIVDVDNDRRELHTYYNFNLEDAALQMYYWHQRYAPTGFDIKLSVCQRET